VTGSIKVWQLGVMLLAFVFCTTLLVGCGGGAVTKENYDKITEDGKTSLADAEKVMGGKGTELKDEDAEKIFTEKYKAAKLLAGAKAVRWGDDSKYIAVMVVSDKVAAKEKKGI